MNPVINELIKAFGIQMAAYLMSKIGTEFTKNIDAKLLRALENRKNGGDPFHWTCLECSWTSDLFESDTSDEVSKPTHCNDCKSKNIILKIKK